SNVSCVVWFVPSTIERPPDQEFPVVFASATGTPCQLCHWTEVSRVPIRYRFQFGCQTEIRLVWNWHLRRFWSVSGLHTRPHRPNWTVWYPMYHHRNSFFLLVWFVV